MRLQVSKTKNAASFYVVKSIYENGKHSSKVVEKLGTYKELLERLEGEDPYAWAEAYVKELNQKEKEGIEPEIIAKYSPRKPLEKNEQVSFNGGYLFLQRMYHQLGLNKICGEIQKRHGFEYDLNGIMSRLLYTRILYPGSKRSCQELSARFIQPPSFDLHQIYRALDVIYEESDFIQSEVYKNSLKYSNRNTGVLYYDCTNYFFETEEECGLRRYGLSKQHMPNPLVQMGLFMDGDGIPLAFNIHPGNTNEQGTLKPLEKQILSDFGLSKFVVCTDSGLSSYDNRKYNSMGNRSFITTQSLKKLSQPLREWALEPSGWQLQGAVGYFNLSALDEVKHRDSVFFKEQWITLDGLRQRLVVSYSPAYRNYARSVREKQVERLLKTLSDSPSKLSKNGPNDVRRFLNKTACTKDGEVAERTLYSLNLEAINAEAQYDGFYGICTNLTDDVSTIIAVNKRRWEIEECFRILKSEFKTRPVYLRGDERIQAHFLTCFLSLILFRFLEKRLDNQFTCRNIICQLQNMNFFRIKGSGYLPVYTRTDFTDALHKAFHFRTDFEIISNKEMKKILKLSQSQ